MTDHAPRPRLTDHDLHACQRCGCRLDHPSSAERDGLFVCDSCRREADATTTSPAAFATTPWFAEGAPLPLSVKGRGRLVAQALADSAGVTIRVDCDRDPAFWCQVTLTEADLLHLLDLVQTSPETAA